MPINIPTESYRIDTVQVRSVLEEFDEQRRAFFNPDLTVGQYYVVPTKQRLKIECQVKQGTEGQEIAPDADSGWIKLAEIYLEPEMCILPVENINNITAIYQGENNENWTNQKNRTFDLGSMLDLKTMFAREHTVEGVHRQRVIKSPNIDFGVNPPQVNGKCIPLGKKIELGSDEFNAEDNLYKSLRQEVIYRQTYDAKSMAAIKVLQAFHYWDEHYQYKKKDPCFFDEKFYYANPENPPTIGESPESHPTKWNLIVGGGSGGSGEYFGLWTLRIKSDGILYIVYDDNTEPPPVSIDRNLNSPTYGQLIWKLNL
jgi:hypothetical protein